MTLEPFKHQRSQVLYEKALSRPPGQREALLQATCQDEPEVLAEVLRKLAAEQTTAVHIPHRKSPTLPPEVDPRRFIGQTIGSYLIQEILGQGGFGVVYRAEQREPIRRTVALKIILPGMDSRQVLARFEQERQSLALLEHPHIAKILDAGAAPDGRPYFVMEYVPGIPIDEYCDLNRLGLPERLDLFINVCEAVQHAHQKGVVHRDLTPRNILVMRQDGRSVPKVIDFGIARAINREITGQTLSELGQGIGTPEYMSPEQVNISPLGVDTRTDVYTLGVSLYELLTGSLPFARSALHTVDWTEIQRIIREVDPPKPSTRFRSILETECKWDGEPCETPARSEPLLSARAIAQHRRLEAKELRRRLSGDLDWIVMKALDKDPARRYASASEFAADVRRYLNHEAVHARPPSLSYVFRKFVRRRRGAAAAGAAIALTLIAGTLISITFAFRAARARELAEQREAEIKQVVDFQSEILSEIHVKALGGGLLKWFRDQLEYNLQQPQFIEGIAQQKRSPGEVEELLAQFDSLAAPVRTDDMAGKFMDEFLLNPTAEKLMYRFDKQPLIQAHIHAAIGEIYLNLAQYDEAKARLSEALTLRERNSKCEDIETANCLIALGEIDAEMNNHQEAEAHYRRALAISERLLGADHHETAKPLTYLATLYFNQNKLDEAESLYLHALSLRKKASLDEDADTATCLDNLGAVYIKKRQLDPAKQYLSQALSIRQKVLGSEHPDVATSLINLARIYKNSDKPDEAERLCLNALAILEKARGPYHPEIGTTLNNLAMICDDRGRRDEAEQYYLRALRIFERTFGQSHRDVATTLDNLARLYEKQGRPDESRRYRERAQAIRDANP